MKAFALAIVAALLPLTSLLAQRPINFDDSGRQVLRLNNIGAALDAHDGEIALFDGVYYLYGTSYGCGFEWGNKNAPFCGFRCYTSKDMIHWTDKGPLFDARTKIWQTRCDGSTYGCFRPHVIYNKKTRKYVLWINVYDNVSGYRVLVANNPAGPYTEVAEPRLAVNASAPAKGLNNGDHDTFVDDDGTAWLAYTDWRKNGSIVIEQLSEDYLTGSGKVATGVTDSLTEAPGLFKRNGIYYIVYSDPNCGYCEGTGTSYKTARSPLGPWSASKKISDNSCGGQPSFVSTLRLGADNIYLYGSDLWNNAAKNEALANYFWTPLHFAPNGAIEPIHCENTPIPAAAAYHIKADIDANKSYTQTFTASKTGYLSAINITVFQVGHPQTDLLITLYASNSPGEASAFSIPVEDISWSPTPITIHPHIHVTKGQRLSFTLSSKTQRGHFGFVYAGPTRNSQLYKTEKDKTYTPCPQQQIKFETFIKPLKPAALSGK